jgi:hypothetical protein
MSERNKAHLIKILQRIGNAALTSFGVGLAGMLVAIFLSQWNETLARVIGLCAFLLMFFHPECISVR